MTSLARKALVIVLDGVGIGALPDADQYGDQGSNTLANLAEAVGGLNLPNLQRFGLGNIAQQPLPDIWTSETYCRFRNEVRDFHFPSCPDCDLRDSCDLRAHNQACWGWNPSCADCLWAQDIVRCP